MTAAIAPPVKLCPVHGAVTPRRSRNGRHADGTPGQTVTRIEFEHTDLPVPA